MRYIDLYNNQEDCVMREKILDVLEKNGRIDLK